MAQISFAILNTTNIGLPVNTIAAETIDLVDILRMGNALNATVYRTQQPPYTAAQAVRHYFGGFIGDLIARTKEYELTDVIAQPAPVGRTIVG